MFAHARESEEVRDDDERAEIEGAALKAAIAASTPMAGGASQEVRAAALAMKRGLRRADTTARVLAAVLGIHETTLCRWEHD